MSAPSDGQFGLVKETTYAEPVAVTRFMPWIEQSFEVELSRLESDGVIQGLDIRGADQRNGGPINVKGDIGCEVYRNGMGILFEAMFGTVVTTGAGPYTHTFTPTTGELPSYSGQVGVPQVGGSVVPQNAYGVKVTDWELACKAGEIATLGVSVAAKYRTVGTRSVADGVSTVSVATISSATAAFTAADVGKSITWGTGPTGAVILSVQSATAATMSKVAPATGASLAFVIGAPIATATYLASSGAPMKFTHGNITIDGVSTQFTEITIKGDNGLKSDRRFIGDAFVAAPVRDGRRVFTAQVGAEFAGTAWNDRMLNTTSIALVMNFTAGADQVEISGVCQVDKVGLKADAKGIATVAPELTFVRSSTTLASAITAKVICANATP